ncbi:pentapeptide repeat-containing protein [Nocardia nepalensis]|uniref:pentapeptide repeat-containing protein n=1 Tax=Nocardia nepalensis TaxID=3375448 RepID=UPI003B67538C
MTTTVAAIAALWFSSESLRATRDQYGLSQQVAVTDRFQKAVEQLASDKVDTRIAGVYLLERLAKDSPPDHTVIFGVLTAFLRTHASRSDCAPVERAATQKAPPDIQAALTVVGRRNIMNDPDEIDLAGTCLAHARLFGNFADSTLAEANLTDILTRSTNLARADFRLANLSSAVLLGANLHGANLRGASLSKSDLGCDLLPDNTISCTNLRDADLGCVYETDPSPTCADLTDAELTGADLTMVNFAGANLTRAVFNCIIESDGKRTCADLTSAWLENANLTGALLRGVNMTDAYLPGANLTSAKLEEANLTNIFYDNTTLWPDGFTPPPSRPIAFPAAPNAPR